MTDQRFQNFEWDLPLPNRDGTYSADTVRNALLMDIRDELRKINRTLGCSNFQAIPTVLRAIRRNTTKRKRAKAKP